MEYTLDNIENSIENIDSDCPICMQPYDHFTHSKHTLHPPSPCSMCRDCIITCTVLETEKESKIRALELRGYTRTDAECLVSHLENDDFPFPFAVFNVLPLLRCPFDRTPVLWDSIRPVIELIQPLNLRFAKIFFIFELAKLFSTPLAVMTYCIRVVECTKVGFEPRNPLLHSIMPSLYGPTLSRWTKKMVLQKTLMPASKGILFQSGFLAGFLCDIVLSSLRDIALHIVAQPVALQRSPPLSHTISNAVLFASIYSFANMVAGKRGLVTAFAFTLCIKKVPSG